MSALSSTDAYVINIKNPQILCLDSDAAGLALLDAILTPRGYVVTTVMNGDAALEALKRQNIDIILLGVILPGMDGFAVCAQIRADERWRNIPVLMMSALKSREDLIRGIEAGADDYLFKPLDHEEMLARIKMRLKQKRGRDSLANTYQDMNKLMVQSQDVIDALNASRFDFQANIDGFVQLLVGKTTDLIEKPRSVVLGFLSESQNWQWLHYEYAFQELNRLRLDVGLFSGIIQPEKGKMKIFSLTDKSVLEAKLLKSSFQGRNMSVENGIGFISHDLCIIALNYGQEITDRHVNFLRHIIVQGQFLNFLAHSSQDLGKAFDYSVYALARAAEGHDDEARNHSYRVGEYCGIIAERMGMKDDFIRTLSLQAILHDVGKIYVPTQILKKIEPLSAEEWIEFRKHTLWGAKIIGGHPYLHIGQSIALNHHEKWDGSGYPRGLKGDAIPIEARIAAIADTYDTLRAARRQKEALDHAAATKVLNHGDGKIKPQHFDPLVLKAYRETAFLIDEAYNRRKG